MEIKRESDVWQTLPDGYHPAGLAGFSLRVRNGGRSRIYMLRFNNPVTGEADHLTWPAKKVTLAEAQAFATAARLLINAGKSPRAEKEAEVAKVKTAVKRQTFAEAAADYVDFNARTSKWSHSHVRDVERLLAIANEKIGNMPVCDVGTADVLGILEPIWGTQTTSARRARERIEAVLARAEAKGFRRPNEKNPADWDVLKQTLPKPSKLHTVQHYASMHWSEVPGFVALLRSRGTVSARAIEFLLLTASRPSEVIQATRDEVDLDTATWVRPAENMKSGRQHKVPLSPRAVEILDEMFRRDPDSPYLFSGLRNGPLGRMTMGKEMRTLGIGRDKAVPHGFRASFKTWATESTQFPDLVSEIALDHKVGDDTQNSYRRTDVFALRRELMRAWAEHCGSGDATPDNVVPMRRAG